MIWDCIKLLFGWVFMLRITFVKPCQICEACKAPYKIPGLGGLPVPVCQHCIKDREIWDLHYEKGA